MTWRISYAVGRRDRNVRSARYKASTNVTIHVIFSTCEIHAGIRIGIEYKYNKTIATTTSKRPVGLISRVRNGFIFIFSTCDYHPSTQQLGGAAEAGSRRPSCCCATIRTRGTTHYYLLFLLFIITRFGRCLHTINYATSERDESAKISRGFVWTCTSRATNRHRRVGCAHALRSSVREV